MSLGVRFDRDPLFEHMERHVDDMVQHLLRRSTPSAYQRTWEPHVDVYETEAEYVLVAELAGVDRDSVTIEVEDQEVTLAGERAIAAERLAEPERARCLQLEIPSGPFERRFVLPLPVDGERSAANFAEGMLTVRLPKVDRRPTRVQVDLD